MAREKGTPNTPQAIIDEIVRKHEGGLSRKALAEEYGKPFKTIKNMLTRERNKKRQGSIGVFPGKQRGRKPAVTLQEYKYENKRLKMENELLRDFLSLTGRK
jgi:transposase